MWILFCYSEWLEIFAFRRIMFQSNLLSVLNCDTRGGCCFRSVSDIDGACQSKMGDKVGVYNIKVSDIG